MFPSKFSVRFHVTSLSTFTQQQHHHPLLVSSRRFLSIKTKKFSATSGVEWVSICGLHEEDHYLRSLSKKEREKRIKAILEGNTNWDSHNIHSSPSSSSATDVSSTHDDYANAAADDNNNTTLSENSESRLLQRKMEFESMFHSHHHSCTVTRQNGNTTIFNPITKTKQQLIDDSSGSTNTNEQVTDGMKKTNNNNNNTDATSTQKKKASAFSFFDNEGDDDAPSCPVRRRDHIFQDQLAFALKELQVSEYFIRKMQKRTPLPRIVYHPSDDSSALFMCRYFLNHRFDEASDAEIIARLKLDCNLISFHQKQQLNNDDSKLHHDHLHSHFHRPFIGQCVHNICDAVERHTGAASFWSLIQRKGFWRMARRRFIPKWVSYLLNFGSSADPGDAKSSFETNTSTSSSSSSSSSANKTTSQTTASSSENQAKSQTLSAAAAAAASASSPVYSPLPLSSAKDPDLRFSYFEIDTIESLTHRLTIIVQPERIITISRYPIYFISEMEAKFDRQHAQEPPISFICDLVAQCSKTFIKAARVELKFVDQLEGIFFEQQSRRERTNSYRTMLYQLHRVSRRASISCSVLPQSIGVFGDLITALQQSTVRQQQANCEAFRREELIGMTKRSNNNNKGNESVLNDGGAAAAAAACQILLTSSQIAASNRKVRDTMSQMRSALALHADVYESTRVVMALFFQESANELEALTRTLTVFSAIFVPIGFITTLFGMNLEAMDYVYKMNYGFYYAMIIVLTIGLGTRTWLSKAVV